MLTMFGWSSRAANRASLRNISTNCLSRARWGRIRFRQTSFSNPAAPAWRARYTSAIPPEAISRTSLYLPMGVVIPPRNATAGAEAAPISWLLAEVVQGALNPFQLAGERGGVGRMCAVSRPHRLQLAARAVEQPGSGVDVALRVVPGQVRAQRGQLCHLRPGQPGQRAGAIDQRPGGAIVAPLPRVARPGGEQIEEPAIELVLVLELGVRGGLLARGDGEGGVDLVGRRQRGRSGGEEAAALDHQGAALGGGVEPALVPLRGEPTDRAQQGDDQHPEDEPLEPSSPARRGVVSHCAAPR